MARYIVIDELTDECQWETFVAGRYCKKSGIKAIVDTKYDSHQAHLCDEHTEKAMKLVYDRLNSKTNSG